jgi:hypothetical protein
VIRRFLLSLLRPCITEIPVAYEIVPLTASDEAELRALFRSDAGQRLIHFMHGESQQLDTNATMEAQNTQHAAGVACGYRMAVFLIKQFSSVRSTQAADNPSIPPTPVGKPSEPSGLEVPASLAHLKP